MQVVHAGLRRHVPFVLLALIVSADNVQQSCVRNHHTVDVAVVGGGIAGLTAAYHLNRGGYAVAVYDKSARFGGKAKAYSDRRGLPVEHSMRIYTELYATLIHMLNQTLGS